MLVTLDIVTTTHRPGQIPTIQPKRGVIVTPPYPLHCCSIFAHETIILDQVLHCKKEPDCPQLYLHHHRGKKTENICITLNNVAMLETDDYLCLSPGDVIEIKFGVSDSQKFEQTVTIKSITN